MRPLKIEDVTNAMKIPPLLAAACAVLATAQEPVSFDGFDGLIITRSESSNDQLDRRLTKHRNKYESIEQSRDLPNVVVTDVAYSSSLTNIPVLYCGRAGKCRRSGDIVEPDSPTVRASVRCCSDYILPGFQDRGCDRIYGASEISGRCNKRKTYFEARAICENVGARLCSTEETKCSQRSGCRFDRDLIWGTAAIEESTDSPTRRPTRQPTSAPTEDVRDSRDGECSLNGQECLVDSDCCTNNCNSQKKCSFKASSNQLEKQIICGYQGWFSYPGDGAPINKWKHWFKQTSESDPNNPTLEELSIDSYPVTDEYDPADLIEVRGLTMPDGQNAKFFSSAKYGIVLKHFTWMAEYGITGVFHMRFMESIHINKNREWKTMVLRNVRKAAQATGRSFAVSYNIAGRTLTNQVLQDMKNDWKRLVDEENITQSGRYIRQAGRPVLRIFGIGFNEPVSFVDDTAGIAELIDWFQNTAEERYRVFLIGGVPSNWRSLSRDSRSGTAWKSIYDSFDGLHPWHVGRWNSINAFENYYSGTIKADAEYCANRGIIYMPTQWAGFSWHNLKDYAFPVNQIPRLGGRFMWQQAYRYTADSNIQAIWMAQFDEVDEGTAIMKVAENSNFHPLSGSWLALDADGLALPSDWYLRLAGEAQKMFKGEVALTDKIPITP